MENTKNKLNIGLAIIVAGIIIAGAIFFRGKAPTAPTPQKETAPTANTADLTKLLEISNTDFVLGKQNSKVVMIEYADYQCPFCGKFFTETVEPIITKYVDTEKIAYVYRDFSFLGNESLKSSEATRCANEQGKYWEYHNYLFTHQNGENQGNFADKNLKAFAKSLGLDTTKFDSCLDSGKYAQAVKDSTTAGNTIGVKGTPHSFIVKDGKIVAEVNGALPLSDVTAKIDAALK